MRKRFRLRVHKDFALLYRYGTRTQPPFFRLLMRPNALSHARFVFVVPKAVARRAVTRNRLRRRAREWVRHRDDLMKKPADFSIIFKKGAENLSAKELYEELHRVFKKGGS